MSDLNENNQNFNKAVNTVPPGIRLRQAREARNLSLEEVASHLRLSVEKITSLERGEVEAIAAPVFVSGYLRAYAKLVGLSGDEVVADFDALSEMDSPVMDPTSSPATKDYGSVTPSTFMQKIGADNSNLGRITLLLSALIVLVVVLYVMLDDGGHSKVVSTDIASIPDEGKNRIEVARADDISSQSQPQQDISGDAGLIADDLEKSPNSNGEDKSSSSEGEAASIQSELTFYFNNESWVEVTDASGQRLLYRLGKAGMSQTVDGVAPFNIQLGYAPGVSIYYNGEPYDLSRYANKRSVRFQLGKAGDGKSENRQSVD